MNSRETDVGKPLSEDPYRNVTSRRKEDHQASNTTEAEVDEDPHVVSMRAKMHNLVEDIEEIYTHGLSAQEDKSKIPRFLVMHQDTSKLYDKFSLLFDELTDMLGSSEVTDNDRIMRRGIKNVYYDICLLADNFKSSQASSTSGLNSSLTQISFRSKSKLPAIELIPFSGKRTQWPQFKDTFVSIVLNDPELTEIDKFHYLSTSLRDSARAVIAQLPLVADNFLVAWQLLLDTYDNQRILATAYLDQLLGIKPLTFKPNADQLTEITNQISESVAAFKQISINDRADFILFYLSRQCLDKYTKEAFELQRDSSRFPTFDDLIKYLRQRCMASELASGLGPLNTSNAVKFTGSRPSPLGKFKYFNSERNTLMVSPKPIQQYKPTSHTKYDNRPFRRSNSAVNKVSWPPCPVCTERHPASRCGKLQNMSVQQRLSALEGWNGCLNCLFPSHSTNRCRAIGRCKLCKAKGHHTLLHLDQSSPSTSHSAYTVPNGPVSTSTPAFSTSNSRSIHQVLSSTAPKVSQVMLGTALCSLVDSEGNLHTIRLAMDSGSQFSFLTRQVAERLSLSVKPCNIEILGIGQTPFQGFRGKTYCKLISHLEPTEVSTHAIVVDSITSELPSVPVTDNLCHPFAEYTLADPYFGDPQPIDFLLGGDLFSEVLTGDVLTIETHLPKLIGTIFGYVVIGRFDIAEAQQVQALCATMRSFSQQKITLLEDLEKLENTPGKSGTDLADPDDFASEDFFQKTHYCLPTGRYAKGELSLSKWASNHPKLLEIMDKESHETCNKPRIIENPDDRSRIKILGLRWDPVADVFSYEVSPPELVNTKRAILAAVSRIYDPLGLLSPLVIGAKMLIQIAWKLGLDWDEPLPSFLQESWSHFVEELPSLSQLRIPRWICPRRSIAHDLLIFGDASENAYCAAAYLRVEDNSHTQTHLICSKAKLAPIKAVSIPRLELCAALLVASLVESLFPFYSTLDPAPTIHLFSDSTVVLGWLNTPSFQLKTFVANRVTRILEVTNVDQWRHVRSEDNPSDLGSRGLRTEPLVRSSFWFQGPHWAILKPVEWPVTTYSMLHANSDDLPELKGLPSLVSTPSESYLLTIITSSSSFIEVLRKFAWMSRFIKNCRKPHHIRLKTSLTAQEINEALTYCVKITQANAFNSNKILTTTNHLKTIQSLSPFLDQNGVLRVGGRTSLASVPYSVRHPIILPAKSHFSHLIISYYHHIFLHPGPSLLLSLIRRKFWILSGRQQIRNFTRACLSCKRRYAKPCQPYMANLPVERLEGSRAFLKIGVDFAGPFLIRESLRRKAAVFKAYLCLFVCLGSKAVHLEAVSSISTPAFLAAFDRFISRRGLPELVMSDNGTNFVGAANQLKEWYEWYNDSATQSKIIKDTSMQGIEWKFNPPHAPHFGGIWEAGVKSAKRLILSAYGEGAFTFEELATLFTKAEAILNSRPIAPLSCDPEDLDALTPGHLLIGTPLIGLPIPSLLNIPETRLNRWKLVIQRTQYFWKRWKTECLHELQTRSKWHKQQQNLQVNDLVLLQNEDSDRLKWPLARITQVFPGKDGVVRVVTVRTSKGIFRRPSHKLIPLLFSDSTATTQKTTDANSGEAIL